MHQALPLLHKLSVMLVVMHLRAVWVNVCSLIQATMSPM